LLKSNFDRGLVRIAQTTVEEGTNTDVQRIHDEKQFLWRGLDDRIRFMHALERLARPRMLRGMKL